MALTVAQLEYLRSDSARRWLEGELPGDALAAAKVLRRELSAERAAAVLELRAVRARAERSGRFAPAFARALLADDRMLQQASSERLARYKGAQLAGRAGPAAQAWDLCCGMGADAIGLARAGLAVRGFDLSPAAVVCATHNATLAGVGDRCRFEPADVTALALPTDAAVHIDPDRRATGRRSHALADYAPGPDFLRALPTRTACGAMKLSPATDPAALADWPGLALEWLSEAGVCKQLLAWWPGEARPRHVATVLAGPPEAPRVESIAADAEPAPLAAPGRWLIEPDPALLAARAVDALARRHGLWRAHPGLDWLFGDAPARSPLASDFEVLRQVPGRVRDVATALAELNAGLVEVKPRGLRLDTDALQRQLRGGGDQPIAVLWTRLGSRQVAFIARRRDH